MMKRIVLAYSGSLESTAAISWLGETPAAEVVTLTLDIGQGLELAHVRERALAAGAVRAHVLDAREEFLRKYVLPASCNGDFAPGREFPGAALSRPLIAARLVDIARMEGADAVAHSFAMHDVDRSPFDNAVAAINPELKIIAPASEWTMTPATLQEYAREHGIPLAADASRVATHANVWGRVIAGRASPSDYKLTRSIEEAPETPAFLVLDLEAGVPIRANGIEMPLIEMVESIETIAGTHAVGRMAGPRGTAAESPAAVVLHNAHMELRRASGGDDQPMTGRVTLKLSKGVCLVVDQQPDFVGDPIPAGRAPEAVA